MRPRASKVELVGVRKSRGWICVGIMRRMISRLFSRPEKGEDGVDLGHLTGLLRRYAVEQQQVPKDLFDLVALKYLPTIPIAPKGRKFVIDRRRVEVRLE